MMNLVLTRKLLLPLSTRALSTSASKGNAIYAWGCGNDGKLGNGQSSGFEAYPALIDTESVRNLKFKQLVCGHYHSMAVSEASELFTWGWTSFVGNDRFKKESDYKTFIPQKIESDHIKKNIISMCGGRRHSLIVTQDHEVYAWGVGSEYQLGTGSQDNSPTIVKIEALTGKNIIQVAAGWGHSLALSANHEVYAWGWNKDGQLGIEDIPCQPTPIKVQALAGVQSTFIDCGSDYSIVVSQQGDVYSFGSGEFGQLGNGSTTNEHKPHKIELLSGLFTKCTPSSTRKRISCGFGHTLAITDDGVVVSFGWNNNGQLGVGDTKQHLLPTEIHSLRGSQTVSVVAGRTHSLCLSDGGQVKAWGSGNKGKLGIGSSQDEVTPVLVEDLSNVVLLAAGFDHSIACAEINGI